MKWKVKIIYMITCILLHMAFHHPTATWATGPRLTPQLFEPKGMIKIFIYEYPPLTSFELPNMGLCSEIVKAAFTAAGITVTIENQVVKSLAVYSLIQDNSIAMIGMESDFSENVLKQLVFVPCYTMVGRYFYYRPHHKKEWRWYGELNNLKGYTYGALPGEDVAAYEKVGIKTVTGDLVDLFKMLRDGKIDFLGMADIRGEWFIQKHFPEEKNNFAKMAALSWETPFSIIFNKARPKYKETFEAFTKGFHQIKQNGKYFELIENYRKK